MFREHHFLLKQYRTHGKIIREQQTVSWLDLRNTFGKHNWKQFALYTYRINIDIRKVFCSYYEGLSFVVRHPQGNTNVLQFSKGLFQISCLSMHLFNMVVNIVFDWTIQFIDNNALPFLNCDSNMFYLLSTKKSTVDPNTGTLTQISRGKVHLDYLQCMQILV